MRNFVRALRHAWPYRGRLAISALCALFAAILWGGNFTTIYPVLTVLTTNKTLHQWIDGRIKKTQEDIDALNASVDKLDEDHKELDKLPASKEVNKRQRALASDLLSLESHLQSARSDLYWSQKLRQYIYLLLPNDCFQTLVWLVVVVIVGITIKCFF